VGNVTNNLFEWLNQNIERLFSDADAQSELTERVNAINEKLRWEIGPWGQGESFLALSPNLNVELLEITKNLVKQAPNIPGWVFLPSKPRKNWSSRVIEIGSGSGTMRYVLDQWRYYLTKFNDGEFFDVNLIPYGYEQHPLDDLEYVGSLLVEFELGEELFMNLVDQINIVLPSSVTHTTNELACLFDQIRHESISAASKNI